MAKGYRVNNENLICVQLLKLRRHLASCRPCHSAIKTRDISKLCDESKLVIMDVAVKWDNNVGVRLAVRRSGQQWIFPCPDPNAHGAGYALTADAVVVTSHQDKLF